MKSSCQRRNPGFILVILATVCWASSGIFINRIIHRTAWTSVTLAFWWDIFKALTLGLIMIVIDRKLFHVRKKI